MCLDGFGRSSSFLEPRRDRCMSSQLLCACSNTCAVSAEVDMGSNVSHPSDGAHISASRMGLKTPPSLQTAVTQLMNARSSIHNHFKSVGTKALHARVHANDVP